MSEFSFSPEIMILIIQHVFAGFARLAGTDEIYYNIYVLEGSRELWKCL